MERKMNMEHFLETEGTIKDGLGFALYDSVHLAWLAVTIATIVAGCLLYCRLGESGRSRFRKTLAVVLVVDEVFKLVLLFVGGTFTKNYLPLHLCNINIFLTVFHAWKPTDAVGKFLYLVCVPAAMAAVLFPAWTDLPVMNFMHLHSFTLHILLVLYPIVLLAGGEVKPRAADVPKCLGILLAEAVAVYGVNLLLDTNYFYLMEAPSGNPLYWFQQNWGNHWLGFPILVAAALLLMFLPIWAINGLKGKKYSPED